MDMKRIVIAQGGGPTAVINESLRGVIEAAKTAGISDIWGASQGVRGLLEGKFFDLSTLQEKMLGAIAATPSAALASTRDKPDETYCQALAQIVQKHKIDGFFYIGGNDTSATLMKLSSFGLGENFRAVHVPKTIDNDLVLNDHVPGYGSAARYVALAFKGMDLDQCALKGVHIGVVMGRHAGFLTAASAAMRQSEDEGPHIICLPEDDFDEEAFFAKVRDVYQKYGRCLIAVSEGIHDKEGVPFITRYTQGQKDAHGNVQLSGSGALGDMLAARIKDKLGIARVRADTLGYMQRSFPSVVSNRDAREAYEAGAHAINCALDKQKNGSVTLNLDDEGNTIYGYESLDAIGGKTRYLPQEHFKRGDFDVTPSFIQWIRPLLGDDMPMVAKLNLPFIKL